MLLSTSNRAGKILGLCLWKYSSFIHLLLKKAGGLKQNQPKPAARAT